MVQVVAPLESSLALSQPIAPNIAYAAFTQAAVVVISNLVAAPLELVRAATMGHPPSGGHSPFGLN